MAPKAPKMPTLDGEAALTAQPLVMERSTALLDLDRAQSGGLDDDPTDSGDPVRNRRSFKNLTGGR
jgi:hypothetical protein